MGVSAGLSVVAFGGGHGLHASLSALRQVTSHLTAVVTVADNGGSSGRLREEFGVLPPGDLRMALAALCGDDEWGQTWADVLQHRFAGTGEMQGHSLGNLLIVGLWERLGDPVDALDWVATLLGAQGRVLPMSTQPLDITARVLLDPARPDDVSVVRGQKEVALTSGDILSIELDPPHPPACPEAVAAVHSADWVILGPGSWYTSVLTHLEVPQLRAALAQTRANVAVVLNLSPGNGETSGYTGVDYLEALIKTAPELSIRAVIADPDSVPEQGQLESLTQQLGATLLLADLATEPGTATHDNTRLAAAYRSVFEATRLDR